MIYRVKDETDASKCDELLTKLIHDEKQYDDYINEKFIVNNYFVNVINDDKNILLCYKENEKVIGYIYFKYQIQEDKKGYLIDGLYVESNYRNKGIAKSLINEGLKIAKNYNIDFIDINVMSKNKLAIKLYESFGFEIFSFKMRKKIKVNHIV